MATSGADPNITSDGDLVLTPPEVDELRDRAGRLMRWFMRRYPELSESLPAATRSRWAGVCRQLVGEWDDDDINAICMGLPTLFPYAGDKRRGIPPQPFDPFKMRRRAHEALVAGRRVRAERAQAERERRARERWLAEARERIEAPLTPDEKAIADEFLAEREREKRRRERARERWASEQREAQA